MFQTFKPFKPFQSSRPHLPSTTLRTCFPLPRRRVTIKEGEGQAGQAKNIPAGMIFMAELYCRFKIFSSDKNGAYLPVYKRNDEFP